MEVEGVDSGGEFLFAFITILAPLKLKRTRVLCPQTPFLSQTKVFMLKHKNPIRTQIECKERKTIMGLFDMKTYNSSQVCSAPFASRSLFISWLT